MKKDKFFLGIIIIAYLCSRLIFINAYPIFNDEANFCHHAQLASTGAIKNSFLLMSDGKNPTLIWIFAIVQQIIKEQPLLAPRFIISLFGLLGLFGIFMLGKSLFSTSVGIIAALLYVIYPLAIVHDRLALYDTPVAASSLWGLFLLWEIFFHKRINSTNIILLCFFVPFSYLMKLSGLQVALFLPIAYLLFIPSKEKKRFLPIVILPLLYLFVVHLFFKLMARALSIPPYNIHLYSALTPAELLSIPVFQWKRNLILFSRWFVPYYLDFIPLVLFLIGCYLLWAKVRGKGTLFYLAWILLPPLIFLFWGKVVVIPRYFLPPALPFLVIVAAAFIFLITRMKEALARFPSGSLTASLLGVVLFILCFYSYLRFSAFSLFDPLRTPFPHIDYWQYINGWSTSPHFNEIVNTLRKEAKKGQINIILHRCIGLIPDGLAMYLPAGRDVKYTFIDFSTAESIKSGYTPGYNNIVVVSQREIETALRESFDKIFARDPAMELIARFENPPPLGAIFWLYKLRLPE